MHPAPNSPPSPSRRGFLTGLTAAGLTATTVHAAPLQPISTWDLVARPTSTSFNGVAVPFFRFEATPGGETRGRLPFFEAIEGQQVDVVIDNQLPTAIRPAVLGVHIGPRIEPGTAASFRFTMPRAGSYLLGPARAPWSGGVDVPRHAPDVTGLAAMIVSRPASGAQELWSGGPTFDREYVLLYEDADDRANNALASGSTAPLPPYEPNYFVVNGLNYPATLADPDTFIQGLLHERILLRIGNLGRMRQALHFHGYHPEPLARNNVPETVWPAKDTFPLPSCETLDLLLVPHQRGVFPVHPHSLTAVTANGIYPLGQLTLMDIR